jgi:hypothetical protein
MRSAPSARHATVRRPTGAVRGVEDAGAPMAARFARYGRHERQEYIRRAINAAHKARGARPCWPHWDRMVQFSINMHQLMAHWPRI